MFLKGKQFCYILSVRVLPTRFQLVCLMAMNFKFIVYGNSTTVADECLIILTGFWVVHCFSNILIR